MKRILMAGLILAACAPEAPPETAATADQVAPAEEAVVDAGEVPAPEGEITVSSPQRGARVISPLTVEGVADNTWYFEGVFPVELVVDGQTLAEGPAQQQPPDNWTTPGPVRFKATLAFDISQERNAELVLREDMPAPALADTDEPGPARTLRIPIVLAPSR